MEIRDKRNGEWHWVYNAVLSCPHISTSDKVVYAALSSFGGYQTLNPSISQISERCRISERQIMRSIQELDVAGFIQINKNEGVNNIYYLLKTVNGCNQCQSVTGDNMSHDPRHGVTGTHDMVSPSKDIYKDKIDIASETDAQVIYTDEDGNPLKEKKPKRVSRYLAPFDFKVELKKLEDSAFRPNNIIAFYFEERGWKCDNYAVWVAACKRHMPAAKRLIGFTDDQIIKGSKMAAEKTPDWVLETTLKMLTK